MEQLIKEKLHSVEKVENVTILHAVESGSRAWGFASPDSDYDIRFIYKKPAEEYLSLWEKPDVIEFMTSEDLDGSGWDLAKALKLLARSNASLIEWLFPPIIYHTNTDFIKQMQVYAKACFSPIATLHHYLGTTKNFIEVCETEQVKLKAYFYALRSALAGKWVIDNNSIPPVALIELLPQAPITVQDRITELLEIKAEQDETYLHPRDEMITSFLRKTILYNQENAKNLSSGKKINAELEDFFKEEINR